MSQTMQNLWKRLFETVFVLALVLISYFTIFTVLHIFFPSGQSLFQLVQEVSRGATPRSATELENRQINVGLGDQEAGFYNVTTMTATLTGMTNNVKSRRSDEIAWTNAVPGMKLFDQDAVQTGKRSTARLTFGRSNHLYMDENSLMIIRNLERDIFLNTARTVAVLVEGQFRGEIRGADQGSLNVDLVTAGAVARFPAPGDNGKPASFKMIVNKDESSVLTVYEGKADLLFKDQELEVVSNQIIKVQPGKQPVFLPPPPAPPEPVLPEDGKVITFRDTPPRVSFTWEGSAGSMSHHFMLARDERYEDIVYEKVIGRDHFSHGNLKPGAYYWRVSSLGAEEEGGFSQTRRLVLVQDLEPPALEVQLPEEPLSRGDLVVKGVTDPDAKLFVNGLPAEVREHGEFETRIELKSGWNVLVLEAVDHVGNVAYFSSTLNVQN